MNNRFNETFQKALVLILLLSMCMFLFSCGEKSDNEPEYKVDYHGQEDLFNGAGESYKAGEKVILYYDLIATDTDYYFYVDGQEINVDWDSKKGYVIKFTMPDHDIEVYCTRVNSMANLDYDYTQSGESDDNGEYEMVPARVLYLADNGSEAQFPEGVVSMAATDLELSMLKLTICNLSNDIFWYGSSFSIQKKIDGEYVDVTTEEELSWITIAYELQPGESVQISRDLSLYGEVEPGDYRIWIGNSLYTDYSIAEEWTE